MLYLLYIAKVHYFCNWNKEQENDKETVNDRTEPIECQRF